MKKQLLYVAMLAVGLCVTAQAQHRDTDEAWKNGTPDSVTVPLTDPTRAASLKVSLISGSITVKAYAGKDVIVASEVHRDDDESEERQTKRGGLHLIPNTSSGMNVEEED